MRVWTVPGNAVRHLASVSSYEPTNHVGSVPDREYIPPDGSAFYADWVGIGTWYQGVIVYIGPWEQGLTYAPTPKGTSFYVEGLSPGTGTMYIWVNLTDDSTVDYQFAIPVTVTGMGIHPTSGPIGTVVTLSLFPQGTGLLSDNTTVSVTGRYVPQGYQETTETTLSYPADKVYYDPARPDEVKIVVGEVQPAALWLSSNPQIYMASSGSLAGNVSLHTAGITLTKPATFQPYTQTELGTLNGTTFTPVDLIVSGQKLIAQVLIKDDGLGSPPASLTLTLQSHDAAGSPISAPPTQEYADSSLTLIANRVSTGGVPGFHTYRSSEDAPIVPWAFTLPPGMTTNSNQYIYILGNGSLRIRY
jgi:hypothetical protein